MSLLDVTQGSSQHRTVQGISLLVAAFIALAIPFFFDETWKFSPPLIVGDFTIGMNQILTAMAWAVAILGLNLLIGFTGQISLGHSFFVGTGAYTTGVLMIDYGWSFLATLLVVVPSCFLLGMIVGVPALRIKGLYLALVTLVLSVIFPTIVRLDGLASWGGDDGGVAKGTRGSNGLNVDTPFDPPSWLPIDGMSDFFQGIPLIGSIFGEGELGRRAPERIWQYLLALAILLVMFWLARNVVKSRVGRAFIAIRDNETSASAMGKNVTARHLQVFILGSAICGIAGAMLTTLDGQLTPGSYQPLRFTFLIWIMVIVGGSGNNIGAVLGGFLIWFLWVQVEPIGHWLMGLITSGMTDGSALKAHLLASAAHMRLMTMGMILLLVFRFSPRGLVPER